ncbi:MAG TPA: hypothetical protein VKB88_40360 [Bryobacteraceae bacterium]|nr:hypothetical protein [Bryobacteraceae bacterium]
MHGTPGPRRGSNVNELGVISDGALLVRDGVVQQTGHPAAVWRIWRKRAMRWK